MFWKSPLFGFFAAVAGILQATRLGISQPSVGVADELDATAVVVTASPLAQGRGSKPRGIVTGWTIMAMQLAIKSDTGIILADNRALL